MNWFVIRNGKEQGPFSAAQLRQFASSGQLSRNDQLRREDMTKPVVAESIKGLFDQTTQPKPVVTVQAAESRKHASESVPTNPIPSASPEKYPEKASEQSTSTIAGLFKQMTANASPESKEALQRSRAALQKSKADLAQKWQETNDKIASHPGFKKFYVCVCGLLLLLLVTGVIKRARNAVRTQASREMIQSVVSELDEPLDPALAGITEITSPEALEKLNLKGNESQEIKQKLVLGAMRQEVAYRQMKAAEEEMRLVDNAISNTTKKGTLNSYEQIPPPVANCINAGMQVWELSGTPDKNWTMYFVIYNNKIVLSVSKADMDATEASLFYKSNTAGVYWEVGNDLEEWLLESHDQNGFVVNCVSKYQSEFSRDSDITRIQYKVTGESWDMQIFSTINGFSNEDSKDGAARLISKDH